MSIWAVVELGGRGEGTYDIDGVHATHSSDEPKSLGDSSQLVSGILTISSFRPIENEGSSIMLLPIVGLCRHIQANRGQYP